MTVFVDTSVWSLTFRRDAPTETPEVTLLMELLARNGDIVATGLVLQEILQGFAGSRLRTKIVDYFSAIPIIMPTLDDYVEAAELGNLCRRAGVQIGTVDALIARLCIANDLILLTTDRDFSHMARHAPIKVWKP